MPRLKTPSDTGRTAFRTRFTGRGPLVFAFLMAAAQALASYGPFGANPCKAADSAFASSSVGCYETASGLTWSRNSASILRISAVQAWSSADGYCKTLTEGGATGWRLPTTKELQSVYTRDPWTHLDIWNSASYDNVTGTWTDVESANHGYWSSTKGGGGHYVVWLANGLVKGYSDKGGYDVVCVR